MAKFFPQLTPTLSEFIEKQKIFFVATAMPEGRINLSPKGMDSLRVLSPNKIIWLNLTGSGNETAAHLLGSNRMTIMFCSFDKKPLILRLYGKAKTFHEKDEEFKNYLSSFPQKVGARQIFEMEIESVQTSCGFAVPFMKFKEERNQLTTWAKNKGEEGIKEYWKAKNTKSIDGFETRILEGLKD